MKVSSKHNLTDCTIGNFIAGNQITNNNYITMFQEKEREFVITHNTNIKPVSSFTGRETELKDLRQRMEDGLRSVLVSGMGGIGKTQICRMLFCEYVGKHKDQVNIPFEHIGYVEYDEDICSSLLKCLKYKKQSNSKNNKEAAWRELEELSANGRLLLFIDNVNKTVKEDVSLNRLCSIPGAIILTSRKAFLCDEFQSYRIGYLNTDQCREIYEKIYFEETEKRLTTDEITDLNYIIESLVAWHTLTIDILAHLSRSRGWKVFKLKVQLEKKGFALEYLEDGELINIQKSYEILYNLSGLKKSEKNILEAFSLFPYSFLSAELCNLWLLKDAKIKKQCNILYELYKKGWLQYDLDQDCYAMHPVFAQFIYEKCKPIMKYHEGLVKEFKKRVEIPESGSLLESYQYIPFVEKISEKLVIRDEIEKDIFYFNLANVLYYTGECGKAEGLFKKSLEIKERVLGEDHLVTIMNYSELANVYYELGEYGKAEELYKKSLEIVEWELGENHPNIARIYNNLARVYDNCGVYGKAEKLYKKGLEIMERVLGENHPDIAVSYGNLAIVYDKQGEYGKSEELCKKSLEIRERVLGENHPETASSYNNLAIVYYRQEEYCKAEELCKKSLEIREQVLGENHPETASSYNNLALIYKDQEKYRLALEYYIKAYNIFNDKLGKSHPNIRIVYENMKSAYLQMNPKGDFEQWLEKKTNEE